MLIDSKSVNKKAVTFRLLLLPKVNSDLSGVFYQVQNIFLDFPMKLRYIN